MANRKTTPRAVPPVQAAPVDTPALSVSLRLPEGLASIAKACSANYGVSLNALVCVALVDYLEGKGYAVHPSKFLK